MADNIAKFFEGRKDCSDSAYQKIFTHLADMLSKDEGGQNELSSYSLYKDINELKVRYENLSLIGEGGMKRIYRVVDRMTDREVSMAVIHNLSGEHQVEQFIIEARITAKLEHPNIMPIYDIGLDEAGEPFFTMKLIRGESLGRILRHLREGNAEYRQKYPLDVLLEIFIKVCDAVAYAHNSDVLHLDLKPDNIQVDKFGQVLVCDWGLARYRKPIDIGTQEFELSSKTVTLSGNISGSPGYMSPEQILKPLSEMNSASDIYSLGCILYEILTYKLPLDAPSIKDMLRQTVSGEIIEPKMRAPSNFIPASLEAVCLKALSFDPSSRYKSAEEFSGEIFAFRGGFATQAENAGLLKISTLLLSRHKIASGIVAASLFTIIGLTLLYFEDISAKRREAESLVRQVTIEKQKAEETLAELRKTKLEEVAPARKSSAIKSYGLFNYKDALKSLQEALDIAPNDKSLFELKGFMELGSRKFAEAAKNFRSNGNPVFQKYIDFCEAFPNPATMKNDDYFKLIKMLSDDGKEPTLNQLLMNFSGLLGSLEDKISFSHKLLGMLNPVRGRINMKCVINRGNLEVFLAGNENLTRINALCILPVKLLDLKDTKVSNINSLRNLPLEELNLSGTLVNSLDALSGSEINTLKISSTKVVSLKSLELPKLKKLEMLNLVLDDYEVLGKFPELKEVIISKSSIHQELLWKLSPALRGKIVFGGP
ncbi:MAG: hypothetical protein A2X49_14730 [Lentisphaerae bacterium GWF2_52_8]|nr:MAG: hypothetical protein A2X49_14730 [Lentisphaerae bacterium GWF2_52_8]